MIQMEFMEISMKTCVAFCSTYYSMMSDDFSSLCGPVVDDGKLVGPVSLIYCLQADNRPL